MSRKLSDRSKRTNSAATTFLTDAHCSVVWGAMRILARADTSHLEGHSTVEWTMKALVSILAIVIGISVVAGCGTTGSNKFVHKHLKERGDGR